MYSFVNSIIPRESYRPLHCFFESKLTLEGKNQQVIITNANTSNGIKINFFWKKLGRMLHLMMELLDGIFSPSLYLIHTSTRKKSDYAIH